MAFCTACGAQLAAGAQFCGQCGQHLSAAGPVPLSTAAAFVPNVETIKPRIKTSIPGFVKQQLRPTEAILGAFSASLFDHHRKQDLRHDKFVLTTQRIIYYRTALVHKSMGEMPYKVVTSVHYNRGFRHGKVIVDGANAGLTLDRIGNDDAAFAERIIAGSVAGTVFQPA